MLSFDCGTAKSAVPPLRTNDEANMDELKWELLTEVQGRWEADIIKAYLAGHGIDSELFQESLAQFYPASLDMLGLVQIFVEKKNLKKGDQLLKAYFYPDKPKKSVKKKPATKEKITHKSARKIRK